MKTSPEMFFASFLPDIRRAMLRGGFLNGLRSVQPVPIPFRGTTRAFRKSRCAALILAVGSCSGLSAQAPAKPADYSQEAFVIEDRTSEFVFFDDGTSEQKGVFRIRLQSDAGVQAFGVVTLPYQKATQTVEIDYVRVRKADGTTTATPTDEPQDVEAEITRQAPMYSDLREKHIVVKGLGVGDVLEYQALWHATKPLAKGQFWQTFDFLSGSIVLRDDLKVSVPRGRVVKWKSDGYTPVITDAGAVRVFEWTHSQLAHLSTDEEKKEALRNARLAAQGKMKQPDVQLTSFTSWAEVGQWYNGLQLERVKPTPEIREKALALTKGIEGDDAKARAIYRYVSTQYRYVGIDFGIGRYQPHAAGEVLANQYGDCKDKHTLLAALLDSIGIAAYPALINSTHDLEPAVPSPAQFDHVITVLPRGDHLLWLDSTPGAAPFSYLTSGLRAKGALVIPATRESSLVTTPAVPPVSSVETFRIEAKLNDTGSMEGKIDRTFGSDDAEVLLRLAFRATPSLQWKELAQQFSGASGFAGEVSDVTASSVDNTDEPFRLTYHYLRKDFMDLTNKRVGMPVPPVGLPAAPDGDLGPPGPLWLGPPLELRYDTHIELPKGQRPGLPKRLDLSEPFAEYHANYEYKDGALIGHRRLLVKVEDVPVAELPAYKKFIAALQYNQDLSVPLESDLYSYQEEIWNIPPSENADAVKAYGDAQECFKKNDADGQIAAVKRAVELDPKYTRAWLWLGEIYRTRYQMDLALAAYRSAVQTDPDQPVSYKALATSLFAAAKLEEAIAVSKKLVALAPDELAGHLVLADSLRWTNRCKEVGDEYELAARLAPEMGIVQFGLGSCLLSNGETGKAVQAFRKSVELNPTADAWNSAAYAVADADGELNFALEYAEKAVAKASLNSMKIDVAALDQKDLVITPTLLAYWDTIGWVYFRLGKYSQAENYLESAWLLSQTAVVGDHLAQVYEKENKKQEALHMYRLALKRYPDRAETIAKTRERMERLVPGSSTLDQKTDNDINSELSAMRTVKLPKSTAETASAEFFVIFSRDSKTKLVRVEETKYIGGSDALKGRGPAIQAAAFHVALPAEGQARVLRRGVMGCFPSSGCSFTLLNANDVHSVN